MERFPTHDGIELAHHDSGGDGPPVVLCHGFGVDTAMNWDQPGTASALQEAGFRTIGLDARGHGHSDKPHDPSSYTAAAMARDVSALLDHLGLERVAVVGYSMGSFTTARLLVDEPRVAVGVLGGVGHRLLGGRSQAEVEVLADALETDDVESITDPSARAFRAFADSTGADRFALAATQRANPQGAGLDLGQVTAPVLVVTGADDDLIGDPVRLAEAIPDGRAVVVDGDHLSAVGQPALAAAIVSFLREHWT